MKLLLFGGTFDPPHIGHMNLLRGAMQAVQPDLTIVMPAGVPPHKAASMTPGMWRYEMCACFLALERSAAAGSKSAIGRSIARAATTPLTPWKN